MDGIFSRIFMYFIGVIMITLVPLMIITTKIDGIVATQVRNATTEFVDSGRKAGYISPKTLSNFLDAITITGNVYEVKIEHKTQSAYPSDNGQGFYYVYTMYDKEDILNYIFPTTGDNRDYVMKNGDLLKVSVKCLNSTLGNSLYSTFIGTEFNSINYSYGGYIGNTKR